VPEENFAVVHIFLTELEYLKQKRREIKNEIRFAPMRQKNNQENTVATTSVT
jgi:hypothetical protein